MTSGVLLKDIKAEDFPKSVILTDDPLRAKMLTAHHLEYAVLKYEQDDELLYFGSYGQTAIALAATGFDSGTVAGFDSGAVAGFNSGAVTGFVDVLIGLGVEEVIYIGACVSTDSRYALRTVVLADGGSDDLIGRARTAAKKHNIPVVTCKVSQCDVGGVAEREPVIDDVTGGLYKQAELAGVEALSVLTVSENSVTGEIIEEHERRSRFYAAARLVFETLAS